VTDQAIPHAPAGGNTGRGAPTVVVGHNPSPAGEQALGVAADLARRLHAHLHVVHVTDLADYPIDPDLPDWEAEAEMNLDEQRRQVTGALRDQPDGWTYHARRGSAVTVLAKVADEHDALMIVVGTRGEGAGAVVQRLLRASVSHGLIRQQLRPVLIVSAPDRR